MPQLFALLYRSNSGFHWEKSKDRGLVIKEDDIPFFDESDAERSYEAYQDEPALFLVFAETEPTEEAILQFVNKYGMTPKNIEGDPYSLCELQDAIAEMKVAADLFHAIQNRKWAAMEKAFKVFWEYYANSLSKEDIGRVKLPEDWNHSRSDMLSNSRELLASWASEKVILSGINLFNDGSGQFKLCIIVEIFLDILWAQFALAISEDKSYRHCEQCEKPFELSPEVNRIDRLYCQDSCRVQHYRLRRKKAEQLRIAGKALREIASEVNSDLPTVKKWLENIPKGGK